MQVVAQVPRPDEFIPIFGMLTGIVSMIVVGFVVVRIAQSQIGQSIARRIQGKNAVTDAELRDEIAGLHDQVAQLEARLAENEERLDFTERLLSRGKGEVGSDA